MFTQQTGFSRLAANPTVHWIVAALTSTPALRLYVIVILTTTFVWSLRRALRQDKFLKEFHCELRTADAVEIKKPGIHPYTVPGLEKRIKIVSDKIDELKNGLSASLLRHSSGLVVFGLMIPSIVVTVLLYEYQWIVPHSMVAIDESTKQGIASPPSLLAIIFVLFTQLALGVESASHALSVLLEPLSSLSGAKIPRLNSADPGVTGIILLYRLLIGGFAYTAASLGSQFLAVRWLEPAQLRELRRQLRAAQKRAAEKSV